MSSKDAKPKYQWAVLEDRYVRGGDEVTYRLLASLDGSPSERTIRNRAAREKWREKRGEFRDKTVTKISTFALENMVAVKARHASVGKTLMGLGGQALQTIMQSSQNLAELKPRDALALIQAGAELERHAYSMEAINFNLEAVDVTKLTDAELEEHIARLEKLARELARGETDELKWN